MDWKFEEGRVFWLDENDELMAETTFVSKEGGEVVIDHTFVNPVLRGQGVAGKMMQVVAEHLRKNGLKASASCSYANAWLKKNSEAFSDIISDHGNDDATTSKGMDLSEKLNPVIRNLWKEPEPTEGQSSEVESPVEVVYLDTADPFWPEGEIPSKVKEAMIQSIEDGSAAHYSKSAGLPALRKAIAENINERIGLTLHPVRNILVTPGSQSGLYFAMMPFIGVGDDVLVLDPCYPSNLDNPRILGANIISVPLLEKDNFQPHVEELEKALTPKTKMLLINQPNNPTTAVIRKEAVIALCDFVKKHDLILISDQAFEDHIYDGIELVTPATLPDMLERTLTIGSISKGHGLSGFRIGYIYGGERMMAVLNQFITTVLGPATTVTSLGAITALKSTDELALVFERLDRRRKIAHEIFSSIPGVEMRMPESGVLSWLNISRLGKSEEIASYLKKEAKVSVSPGNHFGEYGEGYIRIVSGCFKEDEKAIEVFNRIKTALTELAKEKGIAG